MKVTITDPSGKTTLRLRGAKAARFVQLTPSPVSKRQETVRLTRQQRVDLGDRLDLRDADILNIVVRIEDALAAYRFHAETRRKYPQYHDGTVRDQMLARVEAALALKKLGLPGNPGERLQKPLECAIQAWTNTAALLTRDSHRPTKQDVIVLGLEVAWALDDAGEPLKANSNRTNTPFMETLRLVRQWADELEGEQAQPLKYIYTYARSIIDKYKPWRRRVEAAMRSNERTQKKYDALNRRQTHQ